MTGSAYITTSGTPTMYACTAPDTWTSVPGIGGGGGASIPAGLVTFVLSGSCPTSWTEVTALNGKMIRGTVAANGNVGTTGGSDTYTPAGTNAAVSAGTPAGTNGTVSFTPSGTIAWPAGVPTHSGTTATFSGSALATHAHELPFQLPATTTFRPIASATFGTGTSRAAVSTQTTTANTTSAAVALSQAVSAGTPAGTVNITSQGTIAWPAGAPTFSGSSGTVPAQTFTGSALGTHGHTFTGTQATVIPAYVNAIFCSKS